MAGGLLDDIVEQLVAVLGGGMDGLLNDLIPDPDEGLIRKFGRNYANIGVEDVQQVLQVSGHTGDEEKPCRVCKAMASKTIELSED